MQFSTPKWKRYARQGITSLFTLLWQMGFHAIGRMASHQARTWASSGSQTVCVIAPHPDDETIGCAGAILRHRAAGDPVHLLVVTDGSGSHAFGLSAMEMASRRQKEAKTVARLLNVQELDWLGLVENRWQPGELTEQLAAMWAKDTAPDIIYAPSYVDFHPEHVRVAYALAGALTDALAGCLVPVVRVYPIQVPLTAVLTNLICDVSHLSLQINAAISAYATQRYSTAVAMRQRRYTSARYQTGRLAESFWELSADQYIALHQAWPASPLHEAFRGLRTLPISDPLAYWQGRQQRQQLAAAVTEDKSRS